MWGRCGIVSEVFSATSATPSRKRRSSPSVLKKPTLMRTASSGGMVRAMHSVRWDSSRSAADDFHPAIRNVTSRPAASR